MSYEAVIGLEVHAQLSTHSKVFCGCRTGFGDPANTNVCPVCLGFPGSLPVLNHAAVDFGILAALALGCRIHGTSLFARKNYFYPDLPKGYQISQYEHPLATEGTVEYTAGGVIRKVGITRVHLEEDAGKSLHQGFPDSARRTYVDFNRAGTPLIEIVTEPDLRSAAEAGDFFSRLRATLVWLRVNDGNMEEGSLRCDANVSVRPSGTATLGTKVEVKNLNSFRFVQKALEYEIDRQVEVVEAGGRIVQETRLWDASSGTTHSMREKEQAHDYRYFPEPDLPPLVITPARIEALRAAVPELPESRRTRFVRDYQLPEYDAAQLTQSREWADYFEAIVNAGAAPKAASNWMMGELARALKTSGHPITRSPLSPGRLAELILLVDRGTISGATAKTVFETMFGSGRTALEIVTSEGLGQIDDEAEIRRQVDRVLKEHADAAAQYRSGKTAALGFLVGQVMKATGGKANPRRVSELLRAGLES